MFCRGITRVLPPAETIQGEAPLSSVFLTPSERKHNAAQERLFLHLDMLVVRRLVKWVFGDLCDDRWRIPGRLTRTSLGEKLILSF